MKVLAVDTKWYPEPQVFVPGYDAMAPGKSKISHMEGRQAIIAREDHPQCMCCSQPLPHMQMVDR